jgi:hypothetical protein
VDDQFLERELIRETTQAKNVMRIPMKMLMMMMRTMRAMVRTTCTATYSHTHSFGGSADDRGVHSKEAGYNHEIR